MTELEQITTLPDPPPRPADGHKGTFGRVLLIGGSRGMSGAVSLAGIAALRGGAGLVSLAVPRGIVPTVSAIEPSYMTIPLPEEEDGCLSADATSEILTNIESKSAIGIGPGLGQSSQLAKLVVNIVESAARPMVIDADGLNALASHGEFPSGRSGDRVLTPHPGEFARLTKTDVTKVESDRATLAANYARNHDVIVLLKGPRTIVTDGSRLAINETGNSGMATGGSGDVLTGLIAALLGQGMNGFDAAQLGAHLHGLAGDFAANELSEPSLIASDLPRFLGNAWKALGATTNS